VGSIPVRRTAHTLIVFCYCLTIHRVETFILLLTCFMKMFVINSNVQNVGFYMVLHSFMHLRINLRHSSIVHSISRPFADYKLCQCNVTVRGWTHFIHCTGIVFSSKYTKFATCARRLHLTKRKLKLENRK